MCQSFGEEVTELVFSVNLDQNDLLGRVGYLFTEPMMFDCIVFGPRSHAAELQATKGQGTNVKRSIKAISIAELMDE